MSVPNTNSGRPKMKETVLRGTKNYKGCVRWVKLAFPSGVYKIERRRPWGWDSYRITKAEYDFMQTPKQGEAVWYYHHYMGTASWWGGEIRHPMPEFNAIADDVLANADQYKFGLHYNSSLVAVVNWMFHAREGMAA